MATPEKVLQKMSDWNVEKIRQDFTVFSQTVNGKPLIYLDNAV